jgi:asparagine synthase (glutamine-hydrolysing)
MCGIAGIFSLQNTKYPNLQKHLQVMNAVQKHRGPDGEGIWVDSKESVGLAHVRLSIIDISTGQQPMKGEAGNVVCYNGEIYNFIELREELKDFYTFQTHSDTEVILAAYLKWGEDCVSHFRGMFAFALWDERNHKLFCARDRFGIKPFYYTIQNGNFYFASEAKTLLPFLPSIETDIASLKDYFVFQFTLGEKTLFQGIKQLLPAHCVQIKDGSLSIRKYWEVHYDLDWDHTPKYFQTRVRELLEDSVRLHLRSDVPVGSYISGGIDSSLIAGMASQMQGKDFQGFNGKFSVSKDYDESDYALSVSEKYDFPLRIVDIQSQDFIENIRKVFYHLDFPVAGPGSFPQFMVSKLASQHLKVVLGGQGGDEIFGGYARYLLAYFEQCIKGAIDGTMHSGNYVVTYESIIPNLVTLKEYVPLMREFWSSGLFESRDKRYFKLINRANTLVHEINWNVLGDYSEFELFKEIFWGKNVGKESYFDSMTHFDFKTLLPALLQVEDRMSMAHGLESRVPLLDHPLVEFVATIPSNVKFEKGNLKYLLKNTFTDIIPEKILNRKDKMGFPVPLSEWMKGDLYDFISSIFDNSNARHRFYLNENFDPRSLIQEQGKFNRKLWGLLGLEIWQQEFHDKEIYYKNLLNN